MLWRLVVSHLLRRIINDGMMSTSDDGDGDVLYHGMELSGEIGRDQSRDQNERKSYHKKASCTKK